MDILSLFLMLLAYLKYQRKVFVSLQQTKHHHTDVVFTIRRSLLLHVNFDVI